MENIVNTLNNSYVILGIVVVNIILIILYISSNVKLTILFQYISANFIF